MSDPRWLTCAESRHRSTKREGPREVALAATGHGPRAATGSPAPDTGSGVRPVLRPVVAFDVRIVRGVV